MAKKKQADGRRLTYGLIALLVILFIGSLFLLKELQGGKTAWRLPGWLGGARSLTSGSLSLEERINNALADNGVTDAAIVSFNNSEKTDGEDRWYYFEKQLKIPPRLDLVRIRLALVKAVEKAGGRVRENRLTNKSDERILFFKAGLGQRVTHYLARGQLLGGAEADTRPEVALIIDDIGNNEDIRFLSELDIPLAAAVLPQLNFSTFSVNYAIKNNIIPFLHLPLEPVKTSKHPGPGVITTMMSEREIIETLDQDLRSVPGVIGVNSHMGSLATRDRRVMEIVLRELKKRDLLFVDSLVIKDSVCREVSEKIGITCLTRDIFIDNLDEVSYVKGQLRQLMAKAVKQGRAIGIGHIYHESTRTAIREMLPVFAEKGVTFVPITEFF